jgi:hypothetical protein
MMADAATGPTRRMTLSGAFACASQSALASPGALAPLSPDRRLTFSVWRDAQQIGRHSLLFRGDERDLQVEIEAAMAVRLGPLTLFQYHHQATEVWRGGDFLALTSRTVTNGRREQLSATASRRSVTVATLSGVRELPADTLPLTHWNARVLEGRLFNPQTGAVMRESVARRAGQVLRKSDGRLLPSTAYVLTGDAELTDWYDTNGVWAALRAKASDGSFIDYRQV